MVPGTGGSCTVDLALTSQQTFNANLKLTLNAGNVIENLTGGGGADVLLGNVLDNTFTGGPGNDIIDGRAGTDRIREVRNANFVLTDTSLVIGSETDTLTSIEEAELTGGAGANSFEVSGWTRKAWLNGAGGVDTVLSTNNSNFVLSDSM